MVLCFILYTGQDEPNELQWKGGEHCKFWVLVVRMSYNWHTLLCLLYLIFFKTASKRTLHCIVNINLTEVTLPERKLLTFAFFQNCPNHQTETTNSLFLFSNLIDIWSLGVILFMLVCGQPPFQEANDSETLTMIMDCKYTVPTHVSNACKE